MNKRIDEIRKRCNAATEGPWEYKTNRHPNTNGTPWGWIEGPAGNMCWSGNQSRIDADFIAHSREDIPYLLGEIDLLQAERDAYAAAANSAHDHFMRIAAERDAAIAGQEMLQRENALMKDMYAAVSKDKVESDAQLAESQRREAAAVEDILVAHDEGRCAVCKHKRNDGAACNKWPDRSCFEWRGPQEKED